MSRTYYQVVSLDGHVIGMAVYSNTSDTWYPSVFKTYSEWLDLLAKKTDCDCGGRPSEATFREIGDMPRPEKPEDAKKLLAPCAGPMICAGCRVLLGDLGPDDGY